MDISNDLYEEMAVLQERLLYLRCLRESDSMTDQCLLDKKFKDIEHPVVFMARLTSIWKGVFE